MGIFSKLKSYFGLSGKTANQSYDCTQSEIKEMQDIKLQLNYALQQNKFDEIRRISAFYSQQYIIVTSARKDAPFRISKRVQQRVQQTVTFQQQYTTSVNTYQSFNSNVNHTANTKPQSDHSLLTPVYNFFDNTHKGQARSDRYAMQA